MDEIISIYCRGSHHLISFQFKEKEWMYVSNCQIESALLILHPYSQVGEYTRVIFYVRREVDLMKTANVNAYIMHIFGKIELLSIHAT